MRSRTILGAVFLTAVLVFGVALYMRPPVPTSDSTQSNPSSTLAATSSTNTAGYTLAQVAQHSNASSCWTAINGKVYDLTNWINQHPGGPEAILSICGTDGSAAFNAQHGGEAQPAAKLQQFYIGTLAK
jgi:cytochrome b involved in lipid metabolism